PLTVRHDEIVGSQQDFVDPLTVQVPTCSCSIDFPFVNGMWPVVGVIDRRSVEVSPDAAAQSIVSESIVVSAAVNVGKLTVAPIGVSKSIITGHFMFAAVDGQREQHIVLCASLRLEVC